MLSFGVDLIGGLVPGVVSPGVDPWVVDCIGLLAFEDSDTEIEVLAPGRSVAGHSTFPVRSPGPKQ